MKQLWNFTNSDEEILETIAYEPPVNHHLQNDEILAAPGKIPLNHRTVILLTNIEEVSYKK